MSGWRWLAGAALSGVCLTVAGAALEFESPRARGLLAEAANFERTDPWRAAVDYCAVARMGVPEGQYRLGMLFAFGQGVPEDRVAAASLFAVAAQQGHSEAQNMLDTIHLGAEQLPDCVLAEKDPPHGLKIDPSGEDLDTLIAGLPAQRRWVVDLVKHLAVWHDVDPRLALTIVSVESRFQVGARSPKSAMGPMQLIPATAARFNVKDAFNASQNIRGGLTYLRWLLTRYQGDVAMAAAGYNAGEGAVDRYRGVPPYPETRQYVQRVLQLYRYPVHLPDVARMPATATGVAQTDRPPVPHSELR